MHMDDLLSVMARKALTEIIHIQDLHTLCTVITEKRQDRLIIILHFFLFVSFLECFLYLQGNVF